MGLIRPFPQKITFGMPWDDLASGCWQLDDPLSSDSYVRDGDEMHSPGIYVSLPPWRYHLFACTRL